MTDEILPALADRYFSRNEGQSYRLAVVDTDDNLNQIYTTTGPWSKEDLESFDYAIDLFGSSVFQPPLRPRTVNSFPTVMGPERGDSGSSGGERGRARGAVESGRVGPGRSNRQFEVPGLQPVDAPLGHHWRLLVKNEAGSLEAAVEQLRLRNLGVSFGVFLVLSAAAFMLVFSAQRTKKLGKLHMEFAAGVSHELRTPLAVIRSAAYNLRSGVVRDPQNVEQYGAIVQKEERRLSGIVEQLMAFAETQSGRRHYEIAAVEVADVVDQALKALVFGDDVEVKIERRIPADLPLALADRVALSQCLQNLISNAVKYGQQAGIVELDIEAVADTTKHTVRLTVMDRGSGVPANDVPHLFDAFYRGSNVSTATPGNGIGLHLVRKIIESQNGAVSYESRDGGGAAFILTIPSADSRT
jgi:signal transduction histidine kinase